MIDGIPAELFNGIGVVGVVVFVGWLLWRAITVVPAGRRRPRLVTGGEAETYLERAEKAEANNETLVKAVANLTAMGQLQKAMVEGALRARDIEAAAKAEDGEPS